MKIKKFAANIFALLLILATFALNVFASSQTDQVSVTLGPSARNTLISSAVKSTLNTSYDEFNWTGGTTNSLRVWIANDAGYIVGPKTTLYKGMGYTKIYYRDSLSFQKGTTAYMYAEQDNVFSKTLYGIARFS